MKIKFLTWMDELFEASFGGGYQRGGNLSHGRDGNRDERKLSKTEEIELAEQSPIFRKHMSPTGWKFVTTVHAAARAFQRRLEFEFQQWREIHDRVAARCDAFDKWKKGDNFVLFYSKSLKQGYVTNVFPDTKTVRIITVLPKEKNLAPPGTAKVLVESVDPDFEMYLMEAAEVEALLHEESLEEVDKETLKSYLKKADVSAKEHGEKSREAWERGDESEDIKHFTKMNKREFGKIAANRKLNDYYQEKEAAKAADPKRRARMTEKELRIALEWVGPEQPLGKNIIKELKSRGLKEDESLSEAKKKVVSDGSLPSAARMDAMRLAHQDVKEKKPKRTVDDAWIKPYGSNAGKFHAAYSSEYDATKSFRGLNEAVTMEAPDGMTISKYGAAGTVPKVGDWLARSIHYSMLSGAHAYEIVGFSGTSTILAQEHGFEEAGNENTRVLKLDKKKKVGTVVKLRVGKRGDVKIAGGYLDFYPKAEVDAKGIKFSGSRYD